MKADVERILKGPTTDKKKFYILCALSDLYNLLDIASKKTKKLQNDQFSNCFPDSHFPVVKLQTKQTIKLCIKKIEFYLSYTTHCLHY